MTIIDLHIHTTKSDGCLSPEQIIDEAVKNGVKYIAITDHDTLGAYNKQLFDYAQKRGVTLIVGVEISTKYNGKGFHVLGYNFNHHDKELNALLKNIRQTRSKYLLDVNEKLSELGYVLNVEKLKQVESVTKANIALDIVENPKNRAKLIEDFGFVPSRGLFIETLLIRGCPAYVKKESITPREASLAIKKAGGKVVLAHPVVYERKDKLSDEFIEEVISTMEIDGIEANYIYYDKLGNRFDDILKWKEVAKKHKLFETIGSDFHMYDGEKPKIGFINQNVCLDDQQVSQMLENLGIKKELTN